MSAQLCRRAFVVVAVAAVAAGCRRPTSADVSGVVELNGEAMTGGLTVQVGEVTRGVSVGPDGQYTVAGLPTGPATFAVAPSAAAQRAKLPGKYADPQTSELTTQLRPGANRFDIRMESIPPAPDVADPESAPPEVRLLGSPTANKFKKR